MVIIQIVCAIAIGVLHLCMPVRGTLRSSARLKIALEVLQ